MNVATGAMASLLPKLVELLKDEYKLHKGVKKDVESLSKELASIHTALRKVGRVPRDQIDEQVRIWADEVRELSYNMEDVVDTFLVRVDGSEPAADLDGFKSLIKKMGNLFNKGKARHKIADMIKDIKDQVQDAAARRDRYRVDSVVANSDATTSSTLDPRLSAMYTKLTDLVGIGEAREELIKRLTVKSHGVEKVSIVGFGGLGKTTLAKAVYDDLKADYHCTAFLSVSQNPQITTILKKMLHMLDESKYASINEASWDETQLIDELRKFLQNKRYLIVIDDIWKIQSWKTIEYALIENDCGSRIITTTRDFEIAEQVGGSYKLKPLSLESSKELFYGRIFGCEEKCPEEFTEVCLKILKKCGCVPLAIITMASLLTAASRIPNPGEWEQVCESIGSGLGDNPDVKNMRMILSLSYHNLPFHLRTCLLYLGIYPEDSEVQRDDLIWKWIGEGFFPQKNKDVSLFEVGEGYFNELMRRSLIQPCLDYKGDIIGCRLHDMMLELICSLSSEENFVSILDNIDDSMPYASNIRRISLQSKMEDHQSTRISRMSVSQVRSVTVFPPAIDMMPLLMSYRVIRVLDLRGCSLGKDSHHRLKYVGNLFHLRYLGLRSTNISDLPANIGKLQFLEVLDVRYNSDLRELPPSIIKLRRLMCLQINLYGTPPIFPDGFGKLTSMEVLNEIPASLNIVKELCNLARLRVLQVGFYDGESLEVEEVLIECICKLPNIQSLTIYGGFRSADAFGRRWVPSKHLRTFEFGGTFSTLPACLKRDFWHLSNLSELRITVKDIQQEDLLILGRLPALRLLSLCVPHQKQRLLVISADAFQCIIAFRVYISPPPQMIFQHGALPRAEQVSFNFSVRLASQEGNGDFDSGLGNLLSLRHVRVRISCHGVTVGVARKAEAALRHQLDVHPNRPGAQINTKPDIPKGAEEDELLCFEEDEDSD